MPIKNLNKFLVSRVWRSNVYNLGVITFFTAYSFLHLSPSSWAFIYDFFGSPREGLIFGNPQPTMGDEWESGTADIVSRVLHPTLRTYLAPNLVHLSDPLPFSNWRVYFQPFSWLYNFNPAFAFSFFYSSLAAIGLIAWPIYLGKLGFEKKICYVGTFLITTSAFYTHWFTHFPATLAFIPLWGIILFSDFTTKMKLINKFIYSLFLIWLSTVYWQTTFYPPMTICSILFIFVCWLQFFPRTNRFMNPIFVISNFAIGTLIFVIMYRDYWSAYSQTLYPGKRSVPSGNLGIAQAISQLIPIDHFHFFTDYLATNNELEISTFSTVPLLLFFTIFKTTRMIKIYKSNRIITLTTIFFLIYQVCPGIPIVGKITGLVYVPANRSLLLTGLLLNILILLYIKEFKNSNPKELNIISLIFFILTFTLMVYTKFHYNYKITHLIQDVILLIITLAISLIYNTISKEKFSLLISICVFSLPFAMQSVTWHPIQKTDYIFKPIESKTIDALAKISRSHSSNVLAVPGFTGRILNAAGFRSFADRPDLPDLVRFRKIFPNLPANQFNYLFNRTATISIDENQLLNEPFLPEGKLNQVVIPQSALKSKFATIGIIYPRQINVVPSNQDNGLVLKSSIDSINRQNNRCTINGWILFQDDISSVELLAPKNINFDYIARIRRNDVLNAYSNTGLYTGVRLSFLINSNFDSTPKITFILPNGFQANWSFEDCLK